jgi:hypothetical protein
MPSPSSRSIAIEAALVEFSNWSSPSDAMSKFRREVARLVRHEVASTAILKGSNTLSDGVLRHVSRFAGITLAVEMIGAYGPILWTLKRGPEVLASGDASVIETEHYAVVSSAIENALANRGDK